MDKSSGHGYLSLAVSHGSVAWRTDEVKAKSFGHRQS